MENHILPHFGQIQISSVENYYTAEIELNGEKIEMDLNFDFDSIEEETFKELKLFLENIPQITQGHRQIIENEYNEQGMSFDYINFYFDELSEDELLSLIDTKDQNNSKEFQLLNQLKLIRIGLYPDLDGTIESYGIFDYSIYIDGEPCNQLLVVITDKKGEFDHITWES